MTGDLVEDVVLEISDGTRPICTVIVVITWVGIESATILEFDTGGLGAFSEANARQAGKRRGGWGAFRSMGEVEYLGDVLHPGEIDGHAAPGDDVAGGVRHRGGVGEGKEPDGENKPCEGFAE